MFGRVAPFLHVHDFDVQHSPKLHPDPAQGMHRSGFVRAVGCSCCCCGCCGGGGGGSSRRVSTSLSLPGLTNHNIHRGCQSAIRRSTGGSSLPDATNHQADGKLIDSPRLEPAENRVSRLGGRQKLLPAAAHGVGQRRTERPFTKRGGRI